MSVAEHQLVFVSGNSRKDFFRDPFAFAPTSSILKETSDTVKMKMNHFMLMISLIWKKKKMKNKYSISNRQNKPVFSSQLSGGLA